MPKAITGTGYTENYAKGKAPGKIYNASTNRGTPILAWVGNDSNPEQFRYFCHGYGLGTWEALGYTVSSSFVWNVLEDEYEFLGYEHGGTPQHLRVGDVVAWLHKDIVYIPDCPSTVTPDLAKQDTAAAPSSETTIPAIAHTCRILRIKQGLKTLSTIEVGSKNGFAPIARFWLIDLIKVYGTRISYYRPLVQEPQPRLANLFT